MITFKRKLGKRHSRNGSLFTMLNIPKFINSLWNVEIEKLSLDLDIETGKLIVKPIYNKED